MRFIPLAVLALAAPAAAQLPTVLHTEVNPANGHTYHLLDVSNWTDAEAAAVAMGGHLVTINDLAESDWVQASFAQWGGQTRYLWIGLTDEVVEGTFEWVDGTPLSYTRWANNEPNNSLANDPVHGEDYVTCYPGGGWIDLHDTNFSVWFSNLSGVVEMPGPSLSVTGACPGPATIDCVGMTPGGLVYIGYGFNLTPWAIPTGGCAGTTIPLTSPTLLFAVAADGAGAVQIPGSIPPQACGLVTLLGFDVSSCTPTNTVAL